MSAFLAIMAAVPTAALATADLEVRQFRRIAIHDRQASPPQGSRRRSP
jgi:hypothetical protein